MFNKNNAAFDLLLEERNRTVGELEDEISYLKQRYNDSQRELRSTRNELNDTRDRLNSTRNRLNSVQSQLNQSQSQLQTAQNQLNSTQSQLNNVQSQYQNYQYSSNNSQNLIQSLQIQLQNAIQANNNLKQQFNNYYQNISYQTHGVDSLKIELKNIKTENESNKQKIISLTEEIKLKQGEIQRLNSLIIKFGNMYNFPLNIIFRSMNGGINCYIICYYNELFAMIEERLYQFFPYLRNPNNQFVCNGKAIKRNESIIQNEIFDKNIILIITPN